jgi:DNA-directed RNA polymerase subunit beta
MAIVKPTMLGTTERMNFAKINEVLEMPNLLEVQKNSYKWFIEEGIKEVFRDTGAIEDHTGTLALEFVDYHMEEKTKYSVKECKVRDVTYAAPLKVTIRLLNKETGEIKQQEKFMGDFPKMTESGTFIINGAERAIVSQLIRSPGAYFKLDHDKTGKKLYSGTIIPNRGAWLEYETDINDIFYVRIDKNRKLPVTSFLRALGLSSNEQIREVFGNEEIIAEIFSDTFQQLRMTLLIKSPTDSICIKNKPVSGRKIAQNGAFSTAERSGQTENHNNSILFRHNKFSTFMPKNLCREQKSGIKRL